MVRQFAHPARGRLPCVQRRPPPRTVSEARGGQTPRSAVHPQHDPSPTRVADEILHVSAVSGRFRELAVPLRAGALDARSGDDQGNRHGRTGSAHRSPPRSSTKLAAARAVAPQERRPDHALDRFRGNLRPDGLRLRDSAPSTGDCSQLVGRAGGRIGWETGRICRPSGATRAGRWSDRASEGKPTHISAGGACASSRGLCRSAAPWRRARSPAPFRRRCSGASTPGGSPASRDRRCRHSIATAVFC